MSNALTAKASMVMSVPAADVWRALTDPVMIKELMWGTEAISDWKVGSPLIFRGEWEGKRYEDKGQILQLVPEKILQYTYFSSISGQEDRPENYHKITYELTSERSGTRLSITQEGCRDEQARKHSEENWGSMLGHMQEKLEKVEYSH